jgi:hypothetical protein
MRWAFHALRWFVYEFLPFSVGSTVSSRVLHFSRLLAFVSGTLILIFETRGLGASGLQGERYLVWVLDATLALLIANLVKECAIWVGARALNAFNVDFHRKGVMLNGRSFSETLHSDGTWRRCESGDGEIVCERMDRFGACSRSVRHFQARGT